MMKKTLPYAGLRINTLLKCLLLYAIVVLFCVSCKVTKPSAYFTNLKNDTTLAGLASADYELKIMKGDRLSINVTSLSNLEDAVFNSAGTGGASSTAGAAGKTGGYVVQADGTVFLHRLGNVQVAGFTRKETAKKLETALTAYMKEPIVQISFLNHKITVMGEVGTPQVLSLGDEPLSVIDALILSGDVKANAKKENIAIIRENETGRKVTHINLENNSIFSSPFYYVQPNDIILVSAETEKFEKEQKRQKLQTTLSLAASGISFLLIILNLVSKK